MVRRTRVCVCVCGVGRGAPPPKEPLGWGGVLGLLLVVGEVIYTGHYEMHTCRRDQNRGRGGGLKGCVCRYHPQRQGSEPSTKASEYSMVNIFAMFSKAMLSPARIMLPASQLSGLSAAGSESSARMAQQAACRPQAGDHWLLRMSRQISPVEKCTLGWKIFVLNFMDGGDSGYCAGMVTSMWNAPPAYGESTGPRITARHVFRLSALYGVMWISSSLLSFSWLYSLRSRFSCKGLLLILFAQVAAPRLGCR
mmetsp:Transcript_13740/g.40617  ORF Transcript_13740/g.40617 Transcript_13740/m.40617 type:complete len:252 (-) Transcript_13740:131-886(-)